VNVITVEQQTTSTRTPMISTIRFNNSSVEYC